MSKILIAVILDRSGSMSKIRSDTIGGFNTFLEDQKKGPGEALFTLVQFDHEYRVDYNAAPIADVLPLTEETYVPRGDTALFDAIGRTLNDIGARVAGESDTKVIVAILTDGKNNDSQEFGLGDVLLLIEEAERKGWMVLFFGANKSEMQAGEMGIKPQNTRSFDADAAGTSQAFGEMSHHTMSFRVGFQPPKKDSGDTPTPD